MGMMLTSEEILDKVQRAFAPFHVVAELQDYHRQLGFRVYDVDNEVIDTFEGSLIQDLKTPANLKQLILAARTAVERKNKILKPWTFESI
jgi:aminoglycoside phosphotransferase family enzyme